MRRVIIAVLLLCSFCFGKSSHSHSSTSHSHHSKAASSEKTVHVKGYTRKDGTYVQGYDRRPPGSVTATGTGSISAASDAGVGLYRPYRRNYIAEGFTAHSTVERDKRGKIKRSGAAKAAFEREHPCPLTGKTSGRCPGYIVDHVTALECGGADAPFNMQWQTTADAKAKDKTERLCRL